MQSFRSSHIRHLPLFLPLTLALACQGSIGGDAPDDPPSTPEPGGDTDPETKPGAPPVDEPPPAPPPPFEAQPPRSYVAKIKDLLTGLAPTADEIARVEADAKAMATLIEKWRALPEYRAKMLDWFAQAFQQTQIEDTDFADQLGFNPGTVFGEFQRRMLDSIRESFARTALALVDEGKPFTDVVTTRRFMLNPPLMALVAFMDAQHIDDDKNRRPQNSWLLQRFANAEAFFVQAGTLDSPPPAVAASSLEPQSPTFLRFDYAPSKNNNCEPTKSLKGIGVMQNVLGVLFGRVPVCGGGRVMPVFTDADWNDFRMVTIRRPNAGEARTLFWDVASFRRKDNELVLGTERVGFMTTPAFFANWATNDSNVFRVTANQTLITALGLTFEPEGPGIALDDSNIEGEHAAKGTVCYGCHITLDPMRDFFRQNYSIYYSERLDRDNPVLKIPLEGSFSADDSKPVVGTGVGALAAGLASHPRFGLAWALKLCEFANAGVCEEDDPELVRIAGVFKDSGFDFNVLVRTLFSSPIVTFASRTRTGETLGGAVMSVARRDVFCDRLSTRLGRADICNLRGQRAIRADLSTVALGIPDTGYGRGEVSPAIPKEPNMFFYAATQNICKRLAAELVDTSQGLWKAADKDTALPDFATRLMGLPAGDPLSTSVVGVLTRHHEAAVAAGANARDALRSTFIVACQSPLSLSLGL